MATPRTEQEEHVEYLLCRFIRAAGEVKGRIRMQKTVFLLGAEGLALFRDYFYHLRGPYSPALANTLGRLADHGLVDETPERIADDMVQYRYRLSERGAQVLDRFESHPLGHGAATLGNQYEERFSELAQRAARELELAATVVYWRQFGYSLRQAASITADLKDSSPQRREFRDAMKLVREALGRGTE